MAESEFTSARLKVSPELARIVKPGAPRDLQISAARGALPLSGKDLLTVLYFLCRSADAEIKKTAVKTLRELPGTILLPVAKDVSVHPHLLDLMARVRLFDIELMALVILHPEVDRRTIFFIAEKAPQGVLERLAGHQNLFYQYPELADAILDNPLAEKSLRFKLGWEEPPADDKGDVENQDADVETEEEADDEDEYEEGEEENQSKYQIALDLSVSEKIKLGLTGDKEWRSIMIKQSNKLVQGAVMKNPRISDGEVLMVAKNKTSSDELIRMILLNKDWMKNYEIKKALLTHPKTPPPKALRMVPFMTNKDVKELARSRQVSNIVATAARKELEVRIKKMGG